MIKPLLLAASSIATNTISKASFRGGGERAGQISTPKPYFHASPTTSVLTLLAFLVLPLLVQQKHPSPSFPSQLHSEEGKERLSQSKAFWERWPGTVPALPHWADLG